MGRALKGNDVTKSGHSQQMGFGRPHAVERGMYEFDGRQFLVAWHRPNSLGAVYAEDGSDHWFGGPHFDLMTCSGWHELQHVPAFLQVNGTDYLVAQHREGKGRAFYTLDGRHCWFGGMHHKCEGITANRFLVAQHVKDGTWALYTVDGRHDWYGGPHAHFTTPSHRSGDWLRGPTDVEKWGVLLAQHEANGTYAVYSECGDGHLFAGPFTHEPTLKQIEGELLALDVLSNDAGDQFVGAHSRDGLVMHRLEPCGTDSRIPKYRARTFTEKQIRDLVLSTRQALTRGVSKKIYRWFLDRGQEARWMSVEIVGILRRTHLLDESAKVFGLSAEQVLDGLVPLLHLHSVSRFAFWASVIQQLRGRWADQLDLCDSVTATLRLGNTAAQLRFLDAVEHALGLDARNRNCLTDLAECARISYADFLAVKYLGSGEFGSTFLIQNIGAKRKFHVLKVRKPDADDTITLEAAVHNAIGARHKNVAEMYAVVTVEVDGQLSQAINMEFVDGAPVAELLRKERSLPVERALSVALQLLKGLRHLSQFGIRHRDLKPDNVMITRDETVKIIDFGLATCEDITVRPMLNRAYAPPEFRIGIDSPNSDVWSFGLILYHMIAGEHLIKPQEAGPYESVERFKQYIAEKAQLWASVQSEMDSRYRERILQAVPEELHELVFSCLAVDPQKRCSSYDDLINHLLVAQNALRRSATAKSERDYSHRAEGYGHAVKTYRDPVLRAQSRSLFEPIDPKGVALDIGCGQGDASTCFQESITEAGKTLWHPLIREIHYVDISREMVRKGIEDGRIQSRDNVVYLNVTERMPFPGGMFDYVITRYFLHDLSPEEKRRLFWDVKGVLRSAGKFQVIDMVADSTSTQDLYNTYHTKKTSGPYRQCWIPTFAEYKRLFAEAGFVHLRTDRYVSRVRTSEWLAEGQISEQRLAELNELFRNHIRQAGETKRYFNLREGDDGDVQIDFPVLLICGVKT